MRILYYFSLIVLCYALCPMAASRDKAREKSGQSTASTAPTVMPLSQRSTMKDTVLTKPAASSIAAIDKQPAQQADAAIDTPKQNASAPGPAYAFDQEGFVKPGEAIRIYAIPDTGSFVNGFYPIDGEGRIYLPIIGKMNITKMTEKAFLDTLKAEYINYLRYPNLQVRHSIRISLLGGFQKPGLYYIDPDYSIWDAVYLAGGTTREDGLKRMRWERDRQPVSTDIIPYFQSGQSLHSMGFKSGDQLWTPIEPKRRWYEFVFGDILLSKVFPIVTTSASLYVAYISAMSYLYR